jgi:hypothetical protein
MRHIVLIPILALAAACGDGGIVQPEHAPPPDLAAAAVPNSPNHGWDFTARATFVGSLDPGDLRITPGNVAHFTGYVNEFALTGDLMGTMYFAGTSRLVLRTGKGPVVAEAVLFDLTSPMLGTFECRANGMADDYPAADFTVVGKVFSCDGTGDFEDMRLKGSFANTPGTFDYDMTGVIW